MTKSKVASFSVLFFGFLFLYGPIFILMFYSFNESKLVTVWGGFSTKWYAELFQDEAMLRAVWNSLRIAAMSATSAVILGTMAAHVLINRRYFRGRTLFSGMVTAPLVMPEVITGLSLLLLFVTFNMDRGITTITIAHITFCMAYVAVIMTSRLTELDKSIEEAAQDLGATPARTFWSITLPQITPALASGWLLSFTLSLDDLVISSFVSGPGSTTLPMLVFSSVRMGVSPKINALATLLVLVISLGTFIGWWYMRRQERKRQEEMKLAFAND
ncbi:Inner membrane ABC transporter permease protein YdcV [Sinobacterium norvegicum]|uniref:Inner membrane ABC transporter permease protein YdcV n=1 Tax=Sinobacterium norvegicum TaxID=1641715 RepID=A0ABM9AA53_9GAMM|nr:ABC transporter permease subunit [Sinobacterium norvegicum]CAH0990092.1 Inner membrane ABC transporter permease protein YdcV [Sinobacterium norvegicum]